MTSVLPITDLAWPDRTVGRVAAWGSMQPSELIKSYLRAVLDASGARAVSVFVPTWPGRSEDAFLMHSAAEAAAIELQSLDSAFEFARQRSVPATEMGRDEGPMPVPGEVPGTVLLPIPLVTSLWNQPPRTVRSGPGEAPPARRAADRQPSTTAGWVALRFDHPEVSDAHGTRGHSVAVCRCSLDLAARLASLYLRLYGSLTDPLTGLPGRAEFRSLLRDELAHARAERVPCSLVLFNPDDLASVNVRHGRRFGDQLLREMVTRARDTLRHTDVLCRYGGAIFAVALRNTGTEAAGIVADKLRAALGGAPYVGGQVQLSFSAGIATLGADDPTVRDPVDFVGRAEAALSIAKQAGGGRSCHWRDGATDAPEPIDRLRVAFTGDQDRDYRNMGLLWDTVGLLASTRSPSDLAERVVVQLRQALSPSLVALFERGTRGLVLRHGLGPLGTSASDDRGISAEVLTEEQQEAVAAAAEGRVAVWLPGDEGAGDDVPGAVTCAVPLLVGDALAGVLLLAGLSDEMKFDESDLPFLKGLAGPLGLALERARTAERERQQEELEKRRLVGELRDLRTALRQARLVHVSPQMEDLIVTAHRVADTDATVLITGESGTGKELLAQTVHQMSRRRDRPLVVVDCGAIPSTLIESELFGHERGAFTGALQRSPGRLLQADKGTVLLDEIGELPLDVQSKLLRFVQDHQFTTVGSSAVRTVDVRVLAATNRDLVQEVATGRFRADLYHRLNVIPLAIPPLRERPDDILEIARHFLEVFAAKYQKPVRTLGADVEEALVTYAWPGNVRELQNRIMRAVIMCNGHALTVEGLSLPQRAAQVAFAGPRPHVSVASDGETERATPRAKDFVSAEEFGSRDEAWVAVGSALDEAVARVTATPGSAYPPLGRLLGNDVVLAAFESSGSVARRAAALLGLPETTFVRRLRRAQNEAHLVKRPPEWAPVTRAIVALVRTPDEEGQDVLDRAEAALLSSIRRHLRSASGSAGAYLLGTSLPTYKRRLASLPEAS